jgi:hypothetical protein
MAVRAGQCASEARWPIASSAPVERLGYRISRRGITELARDLFGAQRSASRSPPATSQIPARPSTSPTSSLDRPACSSAWGRVRAVP